MKLIILRHGEREPQYHHYTTSLTEKGKQQAKNLANTLPYDIDQIYCSAFIRTVNTIAPYCEKYGKKIKIEYSFYQNCCMPDYKYNDYLCNNKNLLENLKIKNSIEKNYTSKILSSNINFNPTTVDINNRVFPFIYKLCKTYSKTNETILIVTHKTICNTIKKFFDKNIDITSDFPQGHYEEITVDDKWKPV